MSAVFRFGVFCFFTFFGFDDAFEFDGPKPLASSSVCVEEARYFAWWIINCVVRKVNDGVGARMIKRRNNVNSVHRVLWMRNINSCALKVSASLRYIGRNQTAAKKIEMQAFSRIFTMFCVVLFSSSALDDVTSGD